MLGGLAWDCRSPAPKDATPIGLGDCREGPLPSLSELAQWPRAVPFGPRSPASGSRGVRRRRCRPSARRRPVGSGRGLEAVQGLRSSRRGRGRPRVFGDGSSWSPGAPDDGLGEEVDRVVSAAHVELQQGHPGEGLEPDGWAVGPLGQAVSGMPRCRWLLRPPGGTDGGGGDAAGLWGRGQVKSRCRGPRPTAGREGAPRAAAVDTPGAEGDPSRGAVSRGRTAVGEASVRTAERRRRNPREKTHEIPI